VCGGTNDGVESTERIVSLHSIPPSLQCREGGRKVLFLASGKLFAKTVLARSPFCPDEGEDDYDARNCPWPNTFGCAKKNVVVRLDQLHNLLCVATILGLFCDEPNCCHTNLNPSPPRQGGVFLCSLCNSNYTFSGYRVNVSDRNSGKFTTNTPIRRDGREG
jgi:hypothetical protein